MASRQGSVDDGLGPVEIGASYDEVGPDLGRLHDAWHADTGQPALMLFPGDRVEWRPDGAWDVRLSWRPDHEGLMLSVLHAPASWNPSELADILVLSTAAYTRVEDSPRVRPLFVDTDVRPPRRSRRRAALAGLGLCALGLCVLLVHVSRDVAPPLRPTWTPCLAPPPAEAWFTALESDSAPPPPWKLPRPVNNQKRAPCTPALETELAGVCWISVTPRPCPPQTVVYEGQCLLPVAKPRPVPASVDGEGRVRTPARP